MDKASSHEKRQAEPLTDEGGDQYWAGNIQIGTPGKKFYIDFDSKSARTCPQRRC